MPRFENVSRHFREKNISDFIRYLILKGNNAYIKYFDYLKCWYNKQLFIAQVTATGSRLYVGPRENMIIRGESGKIVIGSDVKIYSPIEITATTHIYSNCEVIIGDRTRIGRNSAIRAAKNIKIGEDCLIANYVRIYDYNGHPLSPEDPEDMRRRRNMSHVPPDEVRSIIIEDNVWIGENAFIQAGVKIG